jgi:hypothetical protein
MGVILNPYTTSLNPQVVAANATPAPPSPPSPSVIGTLTLPDSCASSLLDSGTLTIDRGGNSGSFDIVFRISPAVGSNPASDPRAQFAVAKGRFAC